MMTFQSFLRYLSGQRKSSAAIAKERLQIIVSHERAKNNHSPDFMPMLQQEILDVISKYIAGIDKNNVKVELQRNGGHSILELNIALPERENA